MRFLLFLFLTVVAVSANQKCEGTPRKYKGKLCASTTHYHDNHKGACGCGTGDSSPFAWNMQGWTVAASENIFKSPQSWCGETCGHCVKLTTTGGFVPNEGKAPTKGEGQSVTFMITNECPRNGNMKWCGQSSSNGGVNQFGYGAHFDLETGAGQVGKLGWDNAETTMEFVDCQSAHSHDSKTPNNQMWHQCECASGHGKK